MNTLFYSTVFPDADHPSRGTYNFELCHALAKEHEVQVIAPREWTDVLKKRMSGRSFVRGENLRAAGIPVEYPTYWYPPKVWRERYGDFLWWSSQSAVERWSQTFRPEAVLSYWAHPDGEAALHAARRFGVPAAVIVGGSDVLLLPRCPRRGARVRRVLEESDAVLTVSDGLREAVIELGVDPRRVRTVIQGVNPSVFHPGDQSVVREQLAKHHPPIASGRPLLLWVGRMAYVKRLDVLIDACAALSRGGRDFVLALAGEGSLRRAIEEQVAAHGLADSVCFLGAQPPGSLGDWYRAADCTVMSSDSEGLPNVLRESLACGTPFVSTDVGSIREIADERYSVLAPPGDPQALAEAILSLLEGAHRQQARVYEPRTWDDTAEETIRIFGECGAGHGSRTSAQFAAVGVK